MTEHLSSRLPSILGDSFSNTVRIFSELFLERHENISILFADICKFTEMTTSLPVDKLVETLNDLFGKFDDAADVRLGQHLCLL